MNLKELKDELGKLNVRCDAYSLLGDFQTESFCLERRNMHCWEVYYSERGEKTGLKKFRTESDACETFLKLVTTDESVFTTGTKK